MNGAEPGTVKPGSAVYRVGRGAEKRGGPGLCPIAAVAFAACLLSGCATQLGPVFGDGTTTGSITPRDGRFSVNMTDEDWRRAQASVGQALDPLAGGKGSIWSNPASGLRGTATPVAGGFAQGGHACQAFLATLVEGVDTNWYQGTACQLDGHAWTIVSAGPWKPPAGHGATPTKPAPTKPAPSTPAPTPAAMPLPAMPAPATAPAVPSPAL